VKIWIVESRMEVPGGDWRPWDGKGLKTRAEAEAVVAKLQRKKHTICTYSFRVQPYGPVPENCNCGAVDALMHLNSCPENRHPTQGGQS